MRKELTGLALALCRAAGVPPLVPDGLQMVAVTRAAMDGEVVEGMRYGGSSRFSGWFLVAPGDPLELNPGIVVTIHALHLFEERPEVARFLALPAGWRFTTRGRGAVWFDPEVARAAEDDLRRHG